MNIKNSKTFKKSFASDNNSGVHPKVLEAIIAANEGHVTGYGDDEYTEKAVFKMKELFGHDIDVYFVLTGTAANVLSVATLIQPFHSVICAENAHLNIDECSAPERFTGCKIIPVCTHNGKLTIENIEPHLTGFGFEHHSQPGLISITQSTEFGTVYQPSEMKSISELAHKHGMFLHVDGARFSNAVASLKCEVNDIARDAGIDVLSFGGTKNGLMFGEAVIFFNKELSKNFKYIRKQGMQLYSKMRFVSAQFLAYLENRLWLKNAQHANKMAKILGNEISKIPAIEITQPVEANGIFARIPQHIIEPLKEQYFFYLWDETIHEVRWMCSFDTTGEDIHGFVNLIKKLL